MSPRSRLLLDVGMFAVLLAAFNPARTGLAVHEWLSLAVAIPLLVHLVINWEWTLRVLGSFVDRLFHATRLNFLVDVGLFVSSVAVMLSGLLVSQVISAALGITVAPSSVWIAVHSVSADATMALLLVHLGLHWRWVTNAALRVVPVDSTQPR